MAAADLDLEQLLSTLAAHRITPRIENALAFARERQVLLLRHDPNNYCAVSVIAIAPPKEPTPRGPRRSRSSGLEPESRVALAESSRSHRVGREQQHAAGGAMRRSSC